MCPTSSSTTANEPQAPANTSLRSADHDRAAACLKIGAPTDDKERRAWTQSLAALPMAIRVQGLARTVALAKDSDWTACRDLLEVLKAGKLLKGLPAQLDIDQPDKTDGADTKRQAIVKVLVGPRSIADHRRIEHEAIEHAGWLKAFNPVEKKVQAPEASGQAASGQAETAS